MEKVIEQLEILRHFTGNTQLGYLSTFKSDLLKEILEYTYNPHKKYKIDEGKYDKITTTIGNKLSLHQEDWNDFKSFLDTLAEKKSATDKDVLAIKTFIDKYEEADFLKMVLFKDLRLNMGLKKFQKVWPGFCQQAQVQLANKWEGQCFTNGYYSRKLDGIRNYIQDHVAFSRSNKRQNNEPVQHIIDQIKNLPGSSDYVFDGELIYLNPDGSEDFQKAVSLIRSEKRSPLCDNIYYIIFDVISKEDFLKQDTIVTFDSEYTFLKSYLVPQTEKTSWYTTKLPNILLIKQVKEENADELKSACVNLGWEGLMYRDGDAPYEFKRTKSLLKIKKMQDVELKLLGMEKGTDKHAGRLGAFVVQYEDSIVKIGSGFSDELRDEYWQNRDKYIGEMVKVQYFEKTINQEGKPSLRFPVFLSFRNPVTQEEFLIK